MFASGNPSSSHSTTGASAPGTRLQPRGRAPWRARGLRRAAIARALAVPVVPVVPVVVLAVLAVLGAAGCEARVRRTPDDTLVMLFDAAITELDPRYAGNNNDLKLSRLIAPGLTTVARPSLEPVPELAETIEQRDQLTWDVTLRPGLRFSDGTPVTSEDVVYTFMSVLDPAMKSMYKGNLADRFVRVEALDERRARFHLTRPLATFLSDLEFGIISAAAARRGQGQRFAGNLVIGAGAYRVASFASERILLERNPHHYGPAPRMPRLEIRTVRDANARALMLVGGSADLAQNALRLDLVDSVAGRARIHVTSGPSAILSYMMMHNEDPVLRDVRVRQAIAHAIDRERIIAVKLGGRAVPATGLLPPSHWAYEPDVARYGYDPERARALLDQAGYPDPDGPGGAPRLRLTYKTSADQFRLALARIIASQLGEVGIEVEVRAFEFGTFFADIKRGNYQIATMQTTAITEPDFYYAYFHSSRIPSQENPNDHNRWRYRNPRVDELAQAGRNTVERSARLAIYSDLQQIIARELPIIPLWHEDNVAVMNVDVDGYELLPHAGVSGLATVFKR